MEAIAGNNGVLAPTMPISSPPTVAIAVPANSPAASVLISCPFSVTRSAKSGSVPKFKLALR
ncbi:hypothetical protein [Okeania sp. SIO1I7]|uniref:hypothetical protein n=1 Tax=Okeania sp. SIO1I7 TaxID=2607772 RepID=UPI0025F23632|nr:hypothetical protein [Okeania sp. SIO1I7]